MSSKEGKPLNDHNNEEMEARNALPSKVQNSKPIASSLDAILRRKNVIPLREAGKPTTRAEFFTLQSPKPLSITFKFVNPTGLNKHNEFNQAIKAFLKSIDITHYNTNSVNKDIVTCTTKVDRITAVKLLKQNYHYFVDPESKQRTRVFVILNNSHKVTIEYLSNDSFTKEEIDSLSEAVVTKYTSNCNFLDYIVTYENDPSHPLKHTLTLYISSTIQIKEEMISNEKNNNYNISLLKHKQINLKQHKQRQTQTNHTTKKNNPTRTNDQGNSSNSNSVNVTSAPIKDYVYNHPPSSPITNSEDDHSEPSTPASQIEENNIDDQSSPSSEMDTSNENSLIPSNNQAPITDLNNTLNNTDPNQNNISTHIPQNNYTKTPSTPYTTPKRQNPNDYNSFDNNEHITPLKGKG